MKIPDIKGLFSIARGVFDPKRGQAQAPAPGDARGADRVELSTQGQTVQKLAAERTDSRVRADMVTQLKLDYESGKLKVDNQAVAQEMAADGMFDDIIEGQ